ncbi:MAG TPA: hypothetical protein DD706_14580, partial [Nitrospiraceae bacterium]|nr:hypothetical protein [Nitrospiraceae bacterium]
MKKYGVVCFALLLMLVGVLVEKPAHGAGNGNHSKEFPSDFDRLKTILQQPNTLSALTPEWLDLGVEHRTRYETFDQSFTKGTAGSNQMVAQRTRILLGIKDIWDPIRFTLELADFRAPVADRGQDHNP